MPKQQKRQFQKKQTTSRQQLPTTKTDIIKSLNSLFYKLIMAKTQKEEEIKNNYLQLTNEVINFGIYNSKEEYTSFIESILSEKKKKLITVNNAGKITKITLKDENNNITSEYIYIKDELKGYIKYKYNDKNKIILEEKYNTNSTKIDSLEYEYYEDNTHLKHIAEYNEQNEKISESFYTKDSSTAEHCIRYNPQTKLKTEEIFFYENTSQQKRYILYNEKGQKINEKFYKKDNSLKSAFEYMYDKDNKLDTIKTYDHNKELIKQHICVYDENGTNIINIDRYYPNNEITKGHDFIYLAENWLLLGMFEFDNNDIYDDVVLNPKINIDSLPENIKQPILKIQHQNLEASTKEIINLLKGLQTQII